MREAARLRIPIIGLVDTNCDPTPGRLRDPRQRRRDPLLRADHRHDRRRDRDRAPAPGAGRGGDAAAPRRRSARKREDERAQEARGGRGGAQGEAEEAAKAKPPRRSRQPRSAAAPRPSPQAGEARRSPPSRRRRASPPARQPSAEAAPAAERRRRGRREQVSADEITAADVKALRDRTGAAMMDCKAALDRGRGRRRAGDRDPAREGPGLGRQARAAAAPSEGVVASYIHANDKVGAMVEVQCETDFVARNEDFKAFAYEVALHVAATAPAATSPPRRSPRRSARPSGAVFEEKAREEGKPDNVVEKIVEGQLAKWAQGGRAARPGARQRREARRQDDRGAARRSWPRRPARTSASPASPASRRARNRARRPTMTEHRPSRASTASC